MPLSKPEALRIQTRLLELGFPLPRYGADGLWGQESLSALHSFESSCLLPHSQRDDLLPATLQALLTPLPVEGIDVSKYQGTSIDWTKVAATKRFVYIRLSYSRSLDRQGATNWDNAKKAGILVGGYHFFRNSTPVDKQVAAFLKIFQGDRKHDGSLPPALDLEWDKQGAPVKTDAAKRDYIQKAHAWLEAVEAHTGQTPIIYTGPSFWAEIGNPTTLEKYPLWVAKHAKKPRLPPAWADYLFWQYSHKGVVPGLPGKIDLNVFRGVERQLWALTQACPKVA